MSQSRYLFGLRLPRNDADWMLGRAGGHWLGYHLWLSRGRGRDWDGLGVWG